MNILKVLGICSIIMTYFGGFLIIVALGMLMTEKIELHFYQKRLEIAEKYAQSIYNHNDNRNILYLNSDDNTNNK